MHVGVGGAEGRAAAADDALLLARAAAREEGAVRALYRAHVGRVHRCVARILGATDADVEDVVQQTFLAALDGAGGFDGRSSVATWIVGIASRRALDHARARWRRGRWARIGERVGLGRAEARPDEVHDARAAAERALAALPPELRAAFVLHEVEGYTLAEIREMTGVAISTLHSRLGAARKRLDAALAQEGALPTGGDDDEGR
jgi:RNA polymerase sigma-70 factor (ECF subfamily)